MKALILFIHFLVFTGMAAFAQDAKKLKEVQAAAIWAPLRVKVDGALNEWDDSFQAYNKSTKLYYTIANDDKNIYLVIKSTDAINNNKITAGGITVTLNTDGKKKETDALSLTFPVIPRMTRGQRPGGAGGGRGTSVVIVGGGPMGPGGFTPDSATIKAGHERTIAAAKEIKLSGFKDITDSLLSIYNEYGIKAAIGYNALGNFTYELAIPIKLLGLKSNSQEIAYNVKVNGLVLPNMPPMDEERGGGGGGFGGDGGGRVFFGGGGPGGGGGANPFLEMTSPSDFWGKYILAKQ